MTLAVIQAGHVGRTTGATGGPGEQAFTSEAARLTAGALERRGYRVRVIPADPPRDAYHGDVFIAIHTDASSSPSSHGASVGYANPRGKSLALAFKAHYAARGWNRGWRPDNYTKGLAGYYGVRRALAANPQCRAAIIEAGFQTNEEDRAIIRGPGGRQRVADAIADAVDTIYGRLPPATPHHAITQEEDHVDDTTINKIADRTAARVLGIEVGNSDLTVGVHLERTYRMLLAIGKPAAFAEAIAAELPEEVNGAMVETAVRKVLREGVGDTGGGP